MLADKYVFDRNRITIISAPKSPEWNFQLAHIFRRIYELAKYDAILAYDIDTILRKDVMLGTNEIGTNNIAVVSFTKKLMIRSIQDLIRYIFYRIRVRAADYVFTGVYWVWRPFWLDAVRLDRYKAIHNGIDTLMCQEFMEDGRYKIITRKEIGTTCMTPQNEDYPWRQFQDGVWIAAHENKWMEVRKSRRLERLQILRRLADDRKSYVAGAKYSPAARKVRWWLRKQRAALGIMKIDLFDKYPKSHIILRAFAYQHWHMLRAYLWARKHAENEVVKLAGTMNEYEWQYLGSSKMKELGYTWTNARGYSHKGTGFDDEQKNIKERISKHWDDNVCDFHKGYSFHEIDKQRYEVYPYLMEWLDLKNDTGKDVLEIGVGSGSDACASITKASPKQYVMFDISPMTLKVASRHLEEHVNGNSNWRAVLGDAEQMNEFNDESFDRVKAYGSLHHTPDTAQAVKEVGRVLRKNGDFIFMIYNKDSKRVRDMEKTARKKNKTLSEIVRGIDANAPWTSIFSAEEVMNMCDKAGLVIERMNLYEDEFALYVYGKKKNKE